MLARKGIFAKPSIPRVRTAHGGATAKAYIVRLSEDIIPHSSENSNDFTVY